MKLHPCCLVVIGLLALCLPARAWWDTRIIVQRPIPLVKEYPAAQCEGVAADSIRDDKQANGGQGGKVVALKPGSPPLQVHFKVPHGTYCLWMVARAETDFEEAKAPSVSMTLTVTRKSTGTVQHWTMPIFYLNDYQAIAQMYFPADYDGEYTASIGLDASSGMNFLVDRLELHDALAGTAKRGVKTARWLTTNAELAQIRKDAAQAEAAAKDKTRSFNAGYVPNYIFHLEAPFLWRGVGNMPARTPEERVADGNKFWDAFPDFNVTMKMADERSSYNWLMGHDYHGAISEAAQLYQSYGDQEVAWNGAVMLCGLARKYPALDLRVQGLEGNVKSPKTRFSFADGSVGKYVYSGWAVPSLMRMATSYDQLFDYIKDNKELSAFVGTKIPWVKTPQDVVTLIDTHLVQCGMDAWHRRQLENTDVIGALLPLVEGPNDVSRRMLDENLFGEADFGMTDAGGVDDQVFSANSKDGVRYIGSVEYITNELSEIAQYTHRYVQAGGDPKYDLLDANRYPQVSRADYIVAAANVAGGFPLVIGDGRDLHGGRINDKAGSYPSRVLGGFGIAILEDGQNAANPAAKRAVAVRTGIGVGHAHQDTLNLDITALGCRLAPDLGGREEGSLRGWPNMRSNRSHNVVEVDGGDFDNPTRGSTTSGTGWTRWLAPLAGCQAMTNAGRATSHRNVSLYERTTAMIDGPVTAEQAPIYVFDVFRVAGGKMHTFCFHGAESGGVNGGTLPAAPDHSAALEPEPTGKQFETNVELQPAAGEAASYLGAHKDGTRQQGIVPDVLEADWRLNDKNQQAWAGSMDDAQRRHIRLSMLGQAGATLMVGNGHSDHYTYDFPFLYVQKKQAEEGMQSTFVSLAEAYAGRPFIASKKLLAVTPHETDARAAVGVAVTLKDGRHDTIFASGHPERTYTLEGGSSSNGEFAFASTDGQGLRSMQLVSGTKFQAGDAAIETETAGYKGKVTGVDYEHRLLTIDSAVPANALAGQVALIGNDKHATNFNLKGASKVAGGTQIECVETAKMYQSKALIVDSKAHSVIPELEPAAIRADSDYYEGTTVSNTAHTAFWKAHVVADERFMNVAWPGYRTSWSNTLSIKDLPDANSPEGATLRMMSPASKEHPLGEELLKMNVTRVDENAGTFYFKMPTRGRYQTGGWQFVGNTLLNSDGSKSWRSLYAGSSYRFELTGTAPIDATTFAIPGGTPKLVAYHYGPGDQFTVPTHVGVSRTAGGEYEVRTNVPCSLTFPIAGHFEREIETGKWVVLPSTSAGHATKVAITAAMLSNSPIHIRVK